MNTTADQQREVRNLQLGELSTALTTVCLLGATVVQYDLHA